LSSASGVRMGIYRSSLVRKLTHWLDAIPHPLLACEIAPGYVAAARWKHAGKDVDAVSVVDLGRGAITPSAVEANLTQADDVRAAFTKAVGQLSSGVQEVALLIPDPVIRVFVVHFDSFPRDPDEAVPMLRWKLKKSVPFEAEETLVSYMRQSPKEDGVDVVTALARLRIIRDYEQLAESVGLVPAVVMSSTLASLPLVDDRQPTLLARVVGSSLTTAIVRDGSLCGYRCTDLPLDIDALMPQTLLEEVFPLTAYYQDTFHEDIRDVRLAGLGSRTEEFGRLLEGELHCTVGPLLQSAVQSGRAPAEAHLLSDRGLDALVGWMLNRTA
jgi:type IV pilus assembly protein PilM